VVQLLTRCSFVVLSLSQAFEAGYFKKSYILSGMRFPQFLKFRIRFFSFECRSRRRSGFLRLILRANHTFARFQKRNQVIEFPGFERATKGWHICATIYNPDDKVVASKLVGDVG